MAPAPNDCCPAEYKCEKIDIKKKLEKVEVVPIGLDSSVFGNRLELFFTISLNSSVQIRDGP